MRLILRSRENLHFWSVWTLERFYAFLKSRKEGRKKEKKSVKTLDAWRFERKKAKCCVQNPVRLGQSRLDNKLLTLKRVGKVENWNWKTFAVQTILQKQANMVKVTKGSRSDSSENAKNRGEILRGPTKKNFRQIAWKLTELEHFQILVIFLNWLGNVSDWCWIRHICVGSVSDWCRIRHICVGWVSDRCRIGVGCVGWCRLVSVSVG